LPYHKRFSVADMSPESGSQANTHGGDLMNSTNVERPNLEQLKKQAKDLLKAWRKGDSAALSRVAALDFEQHTPRLHLAQLTIARELGYSGWTQLKAWVESFASGLDEASERLCRLALIDSISPNRETSIRHLLEQYPDIGQSSLYMAALLGEVETVEKALGMDPDWVNRKGGPVNREPLLYACFSWFLKHEEARKPGIREVVARLLHAGADPNVAYLYPDENSSESSPLSVLYGAAGVANDIEITRMLLDAGANVNDGETCYHASEEPGCRCLALVFEREVNEDSLRHAIFRKLDFEDVPGLRLILERGANPNFHWEPGNNTPLHHAVIRGRSTETMQCLLEAGANPNLTNDDGDTPYVLVRRLGRTDIAELLVAHGANETLSPLDEIIALCAEGKRPTHLEQARRLVEGATPAQQGILQELSGAGNGAGVEALLDCGFAVDGTDTPDEEGRVLPTPLHWASWMGRAAVVELLLKREAKTDLLEKWHHSLPLGWVCHGSVYSKAALPEEYARCARLLLENGSPRFTWEQEWWQEEGGAAPEVQAVISEFAGE
jgi:ankyrin repeat protein